MIRTRVLLADDHALVRQGLRAFLERQGFQVVSEASNGQEALRNAAQTSPDIAILDISMPILNGVDAARQLKKSSPKVGVIVLTKHEEDQYVEESVRAGVNGYVLKSQVASDLVRAIEHVCEGARYYSPRVSQVALNTPPANDRRSAQSLSSRERQVLQLVAEGKSTKEIARQMGIAAKTAESHRAKLMKKLDIHQTAGLVRYAVRRGLIEP